MGGEFGTSNFNPLNPITAGTGGNASTYVVKSGDTLAGIAAALWGFGVNVTASSGTRNLPASFDPVTAGLSADLLPFDPLLDAIAFSRGRIAVGLPGTSAIVLPAWAEPARVVEDCGV